MRVGYISETFVSFQGEGVHAGRRHLFVRMAGCNLRCRYCDTPDSLERVPQFSIHEAGGATRVVSNPVTSAELLRNTSLVLADDEPIDGTALTGGEPLLQAEFLAELLALRALPGPILLETSGVLPDRLRVVLPHVDIVSMDLKIPSNTGEPEFWEQHREFLALAGMKAYVKILVDRQTSEADLTVAAELVRATAPQVPVFVQPITDPTGRADMTPDLLRRCFSAVRSRVRDVRVLPQTHKMLGIP